MNQQPSTADYPATEPQIKAIYAIASAVNMLPEAIPILAGKQLVDLTRREASQLIDKLKATQAAPATQARGMNADRFAARIAALRTAGEALGNVPLSDFEQLQSRLFSLAARCEQWLYRD